MKSITQTAIDVWESHVGELVITNETIERMAYEASVKYTGEQSRYVVVKLARMIITDLADAQLGAARLLERQFRDAYVRKSEGVEPWVAEMNRMVDAEHSKECFKAEDEAFLRRVSNVVDVHDVYSDQAIKDGMVAEDEELKRLGGGRDPSAPVRHVVNCKLCGKKVDSATAHLHEGGWVGDECCWDERLRTTA